MWHAVSTGLQDTAGLWESARTTIISKARRTMINPIAIHIAHLRPVLSHPRNARIHPVKHPRLLETISPVVIERSGCDSLNTNDDTLKSFSWVSKRLSKVLIPDNPAKHTLIVTKKNESQLTCDSNSPLKGLALSKEVVMMAGFTNTHRRKALLGVGVDDKRGPLPRKCPIHNPVE
jgi:hypothetical protein